VPASVAEIVAEIDSLLQPHRFEDYGPNGLQVPGPPPGPSSPGPSSPGASSAGSPSTGQPPPYPPEVSTIATGVSASAELFEMAAHARAGLLLVHHGLFWGSSWSPSQGAGPIDPQLRHRLKLLFDADIPLAAYHLPLDAHPELGNNALIARALGAERLDEPFAIHRGEPIGCLASFPGEGITAAELIARTQAITHREPLVFDPGPPNVHRLAIVSGAGVDYLPDAASAGADAFLTGEPAERAMTHAQELGLHFLAAGHYATETFGVRALGDLLADRFALRHIFLDVPNPV
jgi:dinuclear metal center YbgI/SA1388 family protein